MALGDSLSFLFFGLQVSGILIQNQIFLKKNIGAINMHVFFGGLFFFIVSFLSRIGIIMIISITWMIYGGQQSGGCQKVVYQLTDAPLDKPQLRQCTAVQCSLLQCCKLCTVNIAVNSPWISLNSDTAVFTFHNVV